jgi:hypothetical protein
MVHRAPDGSEQRSTSVRYHQRGQASSVAGHIEEVGSRADSCRVDANVACSTDALTASTRNGGPTVVSSATSSHESGAFVAWTADAGSRPRRTNMSGSSASPA